MVAFLPIAGRIGNSVGSESKPNRLGYIDWMRGLACVLMFQAHCYDSWLRPNARQTGFFMWSQLMGTMPAPLFLFLAGISLALVTEKARSRGVPAGEISRTSIRRGAEILGLGLLFRIQQYAFNWRWSPWTDMFRVDILNIIGLSMMLMAAAVWLAQRLAGTRPASPGRTRIIVIACAMLAAAGISLATPPLWTTHRLRWLPWVLETYFNGVHNWGEPKNYLFPIFPWAGFAFAGLATGFILLSDWAKRHSALMFPLCGAAGAGFVILGRWVDQMPRQFYAVYSFWTTSPEFFLVRVGLLLLILFAAFAWCRWGVGQRGFSPLIQLGRTSLLVYWVHIELVYGRMIVLPSRANSVRVASAGLLFIAVFMLVLSLLRTHYGPMISSRLSRKRQDELGPAFQRRGAAQ